MTIPEFDEHGNLPPGIHVASWDEVASRFGETSERLRLLVGLRAALDLLAACGCQDAWIDGSFITAVEREEGRSPRDVDVCWNLAGVELDRMLIFAPDFHPIHGNRDMTRRRFGGDYFPVLRLLMPGIVTDFQRDRQGRQKGIVQLSLISERGAEQ